MANFAAGLSKRWSGILFVFVNRNRDNFLLLFCGNGPGYSPENEATGVPRIESRTSVDVTAVSGLRWGSNKSITTQRKTWCMHILLACNKELPMCLRKLEVAVSFLVPSQNIR
jgi:hypothetical protein